MSFHTVTPQPGRVPTEVCVSVVEYADRATRVRITIHAEMLRKLGWSDKQLLEVQYGEGTDQGYVRLRPSQDVGFRLKRGGNTSRFQVQFRPPEKSPEAFRGSPAQFYINPTDRSLKIRLPWFNAQALRVA